MSILHIEKIATLAGHRDCIYTLLHASDTGFLYSADGNGMVAKWNLHQPEVGDLVVKVSNSVYAMALLPIQNQLLIAQNFSGIHRIDLENKREISSLQMNSVNIFDIQIFGNNALVAGGDGVVSIVDLEYWAIRKHLKASDKSARCIAINPASGEFAVGYSDHYIRIFDLHSYELKYLIHAHKNSVFSVCYSPEGKYLLSGSRDAHLKIWNVQQQYTIQNSIVAHMFAINSIHYSPDAQYFATGSMDKSVKIWSAQSFQLLKVLDKARHAGHSTSVNKVIWATSHPYLLSAGDDRMIGVWKF
jgi:WD40 repeat protein